MGEDDGMIGSEDTLLSSGRHSQYSSTSSQTPSMHTHTSLDSAYVSQPLASSGGARPKSGSSKSLDGKKGTSKKAKDVTDRLFPGTPSKRAPNEKRPPKSPSGKSQKKKEPVKSSSTPSLAQAATKEQSTRKLNNSSPRLTRLSSSSQADIPATIDESLEAEGDKVLRNQHESEGDGAFELKMYSPDDSAFESPDSSIDFTTSKKPKMDSGLQVTFESKQDNIAGVETVIALDGLDTSQPHIVSHTDSTFQTVSQAGTKKTKKPKSKTSKDDPESGLSTGKRKSKATKEGRKVSSRSSSQSSIGKPMSKYRSESQDGVRSVGSDDQTVALSSDIDVRFRSSSEPAELIHSPAATLCRSKQPSSDSPVVKSDSDSNSRRTSVSSVTEQPSARRKQIKSGAKRTLSFKGKDPTKAGESFLSKPKKSKKNDFNVEIYIPAGSVGGGGGTNLPIGSGIAGDDDPFRPSSDPTHDVFARSLHSSSMGSDRSHSSTSGFVHEEVCGFLDNGTKIIRRQRLPPTEQEIEEELKKRKQTSQIFIPHKLQDGRTDSLDSTDGSIVASGAATHLETCSSSKHISVGEVEEFAADQDSPMPEMADRDDGVITTPQLTEAQLDQEFTDDSLEGEQGERQSAIATSVLPSGVTESDQLNVVHPSSFVSAAAEQLLVMENNSHRTDDTTPNIPDSLLNTGSTGQHLRFVFINVNCTP